MTYGGVIKVAGKYSKEMKPQEVKQRLERGEALTILDVREDNEWESGHIPGARHIPLGLLGQRHTELDPEKETIVVCRSGNRSGLACEMLESFGYKVMNMPGGMMEWTGEVEY
ncbi:rhodanese domain-containing protein [Paenibacillus naphthalenovorans]|uniref:Rhodanese domain-containing protein n=2 Tax=Paenibacillus TaxID=44249 RepID=A0A0U2W897_9BACL|nr:rhodanese domain-containing protein [Paenibacillus naphthalenovorans]SDJ72105.1 Rhodanese-related sulfurtransferase [Paenibacillus naphthalenovorans]